MLNMLLAGVTKHRHGVPALHCIMQVALQQLMQAVNVTCQECVLLKVRVEGCRGQPPSTPGLAVHERTEQCAITYQMLLYWYIGWRHASQHPPSHPDIDRGVVTGLHPCCLQASIHDPGKVKLLHLHHRNCCSGHNRSDIKPLFVSEVLECRGGFMQERRE